MSETVREVCPACTHDMRYHFQDVTGVIRCILVQRGVTTGGVVGLPWAVECTCADMALPGAGA